MSVNNIKNNNKIQKNSNNLNLTKLILKNNEVINKESINMATFKDLYEFIQNFKEDNIIKWLEEPWIGKDKQESLLRLFAGLGLVDKLNSYDICKGNFNKKTISKNISIKDVFYNEKNNLINIKDKGDASDLTGILKENNKHLLVTTSKNLNKTQVGKLDIDKILTNFQQYNDDGFTMSLCICIRNNNDFQSMKKGIEETNKQLRLILEKEDTIIIDWNDLNQAYHHFKMYFVNKSLDSIIDLNKNTLILKMHQHLGVLKTLKMKNSGKKKILWGHIQRSGKSYIIGGCIIKDSKDKDECNYLILTTAPNETIEQQRKVFDCIQLNDFNIVVLNGQNKQPILTKKNIILCSKQYLENKIDDLKITLTDKKRTIKKYLNKDKIKVEKKYSDNEIKKLIEKYDIKDKEIMEDKPISKIDWLHKMSINMRFIDESHNGGTTELAQKTLEFYGKTSFTVQITATYSKPINDYNIPKDSWILWDLEDIKLCKNIIKEGNIDRLVQKHGVDIDKIIKKYSMNNIIVEYSKYPELWLLTDKLSEDTIEKIKNRNKLKEHEYDGDSMEGRFLLNDEKYVSNKIIESTFQAPDKVLDIFYRIFGKKSKDEFGDIYDENYPRNNVYMERIKNISNNPETKSRFIGEGDFKNEPMIIMAFLPQDNIDKISKATIKLLEQNKVITDYEIISINSKTTNNPKQSIEDARIKARHRCKKGVLVLSGKQCSLGVSINNCDIVLLLNNCMGFDMIYQMMFRCMTEATNKKCGFVIDLNIHRVIETSVINYASLIKPDNHPKDATKFILQERLINLNGDHWMPSFGNDVTKITALCENVYELYTSNTENALNQFLNRLRFKEMLLTQKEQEIFNAMFSNTTPTQQQKELIDKMKEDEEEDEKIKKGIEKKPVEKNKNNDETKNNDEIEYLYKESKEKEDKKINYMDILKHIIPLICLLTIHNKKTSFIEMFNIIENDNYIYNILIDQTKSWWGKSIDSKIIKNFINLYIKYMKDDKETNQIIRTVKELFMKNIKNNRELSNLIDKYLIPQELEKKSNAEVSTPFKLRQEMLDKIPVVFWTTPKKVFEPCAGKGGFIVDIIDRFMNGLKDIIPDKKLQYKTILEECLYFSDINSTNIFICKLLIDPYTEYKLNYNEGNTLEIDIKDKWDIDGFDAVIGNPPYNLTENSRNTLWDLFVKYSIQILKSNGLLLYVHPALWRKPVSNKSKIYGLFELMTKTNTIIYLEIHDTKDGVKTFKCGTRYDYYLLKKEINNNFKSKIIDEDGKEHLIDISKLNWLANKKYKLIKNITNNNKKIEIIYSRSAYGNDKKWTSRTKTNKFKYPCILSTPEKGIRYMYSEHKNNGHFEIKKIIFGETSTYNSFYDDKGLYGLTDGAIAIQEDNNDIANNILNAIKSNKFIELLNACSWSNYRIEWNMLKDLNIDFWKEFI